MTTAIEAPPKAQELTGTSYHFVVDYIRPIVYAELSIGPIGDFRKFGGKLRMPEESWVSFITALQAGAQVMGDRVEIRTGSMNGTRKSI